MSAITLEPSLEHLSGWCPQRWGSLCHVSRLAQCHGIFLGSDPGLISRYLGVLGTTLAPIVRNTSSSLPPWDLAKSFLNIRQGTPVLESTGRSRFLGPQSLGILINRLELVI